MYGTEVSVSAECQYHHALWDCWIAIFFMLNVSMFLGFVFPSHFKTWTKGPPARHVYEYE